MNDYHEQQQRAKRNLLYLEPNEMNKSELLKALDSAEYIINMSSRMLADSQVRASKIRERLRHGTFDLILGRGKTTPKEDLQNTFMGSNQKRKSTKAKN